MIEPTAIRAMTTLETGSATTPSRAGQTDTLVGEDGADSSAAGLVFHFVVGTLTNCRGRAFDHSAKASERKR